MGARIDRNVIPGLHRIFRPTGAHHVNRRGKLVMVQCCNSPLSFFAST